MPDEQQLPPGPRRELATALHDLYELAGKPSARTISAYIRDRDDLPGTLSHEGVSAMLRGAGMPRWANLESLVRVLVEQQRVGQADVDTVVMRIHGLWRIADGGSPLLRESSPVLPAVQETASTGELVPDGGDPQAGSGSDGPIREPAAQGLLMRWNPRQRTLDIFDRQMAAEIFKEVGDSNDQP